MFLVSVYFKNFRTPTNALCNLSNLFWLCFSNELLCSIGFTYLSSCVYCMNAGKIFFS